jgi:hypothetical protein
MVVDDEYESVLKLDLMTLDPRVDQCSECGSITEANVGRYVSCRLQCVLPDLTGEMPCVTCEWLCSDL